jgi:hypothetical protein
MRNIVNFTLTGKPPAGSRMVMSPQATPWAFPRVAPPKAFLDASDWPGIMELARQTAALVR